MNSFSRSASWLLTLLVLPAAPYTYTTAISVHHHQQHDDQQRSILQPMQQHGDLQLNDVDVAAVETDANTKVWSWASPGPVDDTCDEPLGTGESKETENWNPYPNNPKQTAQLKEYITDMEKWLAIVGDQPGHLWISYAEDRSGTLEDIWASKKKETGDGPIGGAHVMLHFFFETPQKKKSTSKDGKVVTDVDVSYVRIHQTSCGDANYFRFVPMLSNMPYYNDGSRYRMEVLVGSRLNMLWQVYNRVQLDKTYYWNQQFNCATTVATFLGEQGLKCLNARIANNLMCTFSRSPLLSDVKKIVVSSLEPLATRMRKLVPAADAKNVITIAWDEKAKKTTKQCAFVKPPGSLLETQQQHGHMHAQHIKDRQTQRQQQQHHTRIRHTTNGRSN